MMLVPQFVPSCGSPGQIEFPTQRPLQSRSVLRWQHEVEVSREGKPRFGHARSRSIEAPTIHPRDLMRCSRSINEPDLLRSV